MTMDKTILLVEDEIILAMTQKMTLERYGYKVMTVTTGEKAIALVDAASDIDLILMDIDLGMGMDGTQTAATILSRHDLPVIFVSSHTEPEIVAKTEKITSYGYVVKNSSITVLDASIKMAFKLFNAKNTAIEKETALRNKEDRLSKIMLAANDGMWDWNLVTDEVYFDPRYYQMSGYENLDFPNTMEEYRKHTHPDDYERVMKEAEKHIAGETDRYDVEFRFLKKSGEWQWMQGKGIIVERDTQNKPSRFIGTHRDITDRKILEIALQVKNEDYESLNEELRSSVNTLRESEERFQMLFIDAPLGYQSLDMESNFLDVNQQWLDTLGYAREEVIGKWFGDFLSPACRDDFKKHFPMFKAQGHIHSELEMLHKSGKKLFIAFDGKIGHTVDGGFKQTHCILQDITQKKKEENLLKLSQERHRFALEGSELGEWDWNLKNGSMVRNDRWAETLGYTLAELTETIQQGIDLQHPDDREAAWNAIQDHLAGRTPSFNIMYRMRAKDGTYRWIHDCGKIMERDELGNPVRVCGTHANVDAQIRSRELLAASNALLMSIIESSPDIIVFALDTEYRYLAFNARHKATMKQIWGASIEIGMNMLDVIGEHSDRAHAKHNFDRALSGENFVLLEEYGHESLSRISWVDYWSPIRNASDTITGLTCFVINNTEQKTAELKIKNLLDEKELLLKEVHHRIKNNMTTIYGLLVLQADSLKDPSVKDALTDAGSRVKSMQLLYDKLYRSSGYNELSVAEYLPPLIDEIMSNFHNASHITVEKTIGDFSIPTNKLQPLGIIVNELLTNIMKYAFTGKPSGHISVSASLLEDRVAIVIADNGNGMPDTVDFEHTTGFGLILVKGLTEQLHGTIRIERDAGTRIVLEFAK